MMKIRVKLPARVGQVFRAEVNASFGGYRYEGQGATQEEAIRDLTLILAEVLHQKTTPITPENAEEHAAISAQSLNGALEHRATNEKEASEP